MKSKSILEKVYQAEHYDLVVKSLKGDTRSQFKLYSLYSGAMYNICLRMLGKREDAEDALQDAFCVVFDKLETFRYESSLGWWIKRIVVNTCINKLKKKQPKLDFTEPDAFFTMSEEEDVDINETILSVEKVLSAISCLPEGYKVIFNLHQMEGYDHTEISQILGISESTSKTQYMKAKKKVKQLLMQKE